MRSLYPTIILSFVFITLLFSSYTEKKSKLPYPSPTNARQVVENYIAAVGGEDNLPIGRTAKCIMTAYANGDSTRKEVLKINGKFNCELLDNGQTIIQIDSVGISKTPEYVIALPQKHLQSSKDALYIVGEQALLKDNKKMEFLGEKKKEDSVEVYRIRVIENDGRSSIEEFDKKTGLLTRIIDTYFISSFSDYRNISGILIPFRIEITGEISMTVVRNSYELDIPIKEEEFYWNNEEDKKLIGNWTAIIPRKNTPQSDFFELVLNSDRSGNQETGVILPNGKKETTSFASVPIAGWDFNQDTLKLFSINPRYRNVQTYYWKLESKTDTSFTAYYVDPEMDKILGKDKENFTPIKMLFTKK
ncbi:hypothetical protein [Bernardetia sp.]|uniref:hypothetical protein n=1 Tax=Bernardetia sp. TaxID=1937974 RepID=UPI0025BD637A|nr:hypothetical protein [Bernardetia sp.]